jgi:hypothetical protein
MQQPKGSDLHAPTHVSGNSLAAIAGKSRHGRRNIPVNLDLDFRFKVDGGVQDFCDLRKMTFQLGLCSAERLWHG